MALNCTTSQFSYLEFKTAQQVNFSIDEKPLFVYKYVRCWYPLKYLLEGQVELELVQKILNL